MKLIVITGPTASGKTALSLKLAKRFKAEIISADSRQVYRGLDIGAGKVPISRKSRGRVPVKSSIPPKGGIQSPIIAGGIPHHLIDVASPKKIFSVVKYQLLGKRSISQIIKRGKIPMIVGGTGHYIESLMYNQKFPEVKPNLELRRKLEKLSAEKLFALLKKKDKARAKTIDKFNKRRLIRALEIIQSLGKVPELNQSSAYETLILGIKKSDKELKKLINERVDRRVSGIIKEIKTLRKNGMSFPRLISLGLEYRYFSWYLQGKLSKTEATKELKTAIWHYAKRQYTWFRRLPVVWIKTGHQAETKIRKFLN